MKTWELIQSIKTIPEPSEEADTNTLCLNILLLNGRFVLLDDGPIGSFPKVEKTYTSVLATFSQRDVANDFPGLIVGDAISPDRSKVFFCGEGHFGILYELSTKKKIAEYQFKNTRKCLYFPTFSHSGQYIAVANTGSELFVIDTAFGETKEYPFPKLDAKPLAWTVDDKSVILSTKKKILFVDSESGQITREITIRQDACFAMQSADQKYLLIGYHAKWNSSLHLLDLATEKVLYKQELNGFASNYGIDALFLDDKYFAVATDVVSIVETATGKEVRELEGSQGSIDEAALSQHEEEVFLGDGRLGRIVNFRTGKHISQWKDLPKLEKRKSRFTIDGKSLIAEGSDRLYIFDKKKQKTILDTECSQEERIEIISPDTSKVIVGKIDKRFVHRVADGKKLYELKTSGGKAPQSAMFAPDSKTILLTDKTPSTQFVDAETGNIVKEIVIENSASWKYKAGFMDNPEYFYIVPGTGKPMGKEVLNVYRTSTFELVKSLETDYVPLEQNDRSLNAATLFVRSTYDRVPGGGHKSGILVYDWMNEKIVRHDMEDDLGISCYLSDLEYHRVLYGCADGSIYRFDTSNGNWSQIIKGTDDGGIVAFRVSPNGKYLAAYFAGRLDLYDMNSLQLIGSMPSANPEKQPFVAFDPNWRYAANIQNEKVQVFEFS